MTLAVFLAPGALGAGQAAATAAVSQDVGSCVRVSGDEGYHAVTVKRVTPGESIVVTDGLGRGATVAVDATAGKDELVGTITGHIHDELGVRIVVVQALPKSEKLTQSIDMSTQFGADCFVPWQASRSITRWVGAKAEKSRAKWQSIAVQAAKQSRRLSVPTVEPVHSTANVAQLVSDIVDNGGVVLVADENAEQRISERGEISRLEPKATIAIIVGPEGGITPDECAAFVAAGAYPVLIGSNVLRTVTAGAAAIAAINTLTGRW